MMSVFLKFLVGIQDSSKKNYMLAFPQVKIVFGRLYFRSSLRLIFHLSGSDDLSMLVD